MNENPPTESIWPPPIPPPIPPPQADPKPLTRWESAVYKYRRLYAFVAALSLFDFVMLFVNHAWQSGHWYRLVEWSFSAALFTFYAIRGYQLVRDIEANRRTRE